MLPLASRRPSPCSPPRAFPPRARPPAVSAATHSASPPGGPGPLGCAPATALSSSRTPRAARGAQRRQSTCGTRRTSSSASAPGRPGPRAGARPAGLMRLPRSQPRGAERGARAARGASSCASPAPASLAPACPHVARAALTTSASVTVCRRCPRQLTRSTSGGRVAGVRVARLRTWHGPGPTRHAPRRRQRDHRTRRRTVPRQPLMRSWPCLTGRAPGRVRRSPLGRVRPRGHPADGARPVRGTAVWL
mmetsp:Transcript_24195/g.81342  ORF Transcript_24195/g.81342 Transcript_24195/m.81342 type:complete len:249 (-) Transcript_24195:154-900(-)